MEKTRALSSSFVIAALALAACGKTGNATSGSGGAGGASSSAAGGGAGSAASGSGGQGSSSVSSSASVSSSSSVSSSASATSSSSGGGAGAVIPSLVSMDFYVDCMPVVGPDPVHGSFTASYDNITGQSAGSATLKSETLTFKSANAMDTFTFTVSPKGIANVGAGMKADVAHVKDASSLAGTGSPCGYCGAGDTWTLKVTWDVGGQTVEDELAPSPVSCVF